MAESSYRRRGGLARRQDRRGRPHRPRACRRRRFSMMKLLPEDLAHLGADYAATRGAKYPPKLMPQRKPLGIDLGPRGGIVDHGTDWRLVIRPEHHVGVEAEQAGLSRAFGDQDVPAA